jgi:hypothetical protein
MKASEYFGTSYVRLGVISRAKLLAVCANVEGSPITVGHAATPRLATHRRRADDSSAKAISSE